MKWISPEAAEVSSRETDNKSDNWALGCVFLEVGTVLKGYANKDLEEFFWSKAHLKKPIYYHEQSDVIPLWIAKLRLRNANSSSYDDDRLQWIEEMLQKDPIRRPAAHKLVERVDQSHHRDHLSCADCLKDQIHLRGRQAEINTVEFRSPPWVVGKLLDSLHT
jgi:serine/threonine protein kinase